MARPQKSGLDYFPLDCGFFNDLKVKALRRTLGATGILTYLNILCKVFSNGYYLKINSIQEFAYDIAEEITSANRQLAQSISSVTESLHYLVDNNMIDKSFIEQNVITSRAIQEQYIVSLKKSKRNIVMKEYVIDGIYGLLLQEKQVETPVNSEETPVNSEETPVNSEFSTQIKVKESKVNKSKEREYISSPKTKIFSPPSINEVEQYCKLKGYKLNGKTFISYYAAKGWKIGNTPMENWQAAVDSWASRDDEEKSKNYKNTTSKNNAFLLAPNREYPTDMLNAMFEQTGEEI